MNVESEMLNRRSFLGKLGRAGIVVAGASRLATAALAESVPGKKLKLGMDNFSVRAMGWKAPELLDYAASLKLDCLLISDLGAYQSLEEKALVEVKARAADRGLELHAGTYSICPTSKSFSNKWGTAEEHLALGIRVAKALGSPVLRCVLGGGEDRKTPGGIEARIEDTAKVCQACRSQAVDAGVKIAIENHAGDMRASELVHLIELAGKEYVGATMDSGNATWALEDPLANLEVLGPHALCTGMRDSMVWEYEEGAKVQWTAMGEGLVPWTDYFKRYAVVCPDTPVILEIISGFARQMPYLREDFWSAWPKLTGSELATFVKLARKGKAFEPGKTSDKDYQKVELERSVRFCRETLGLGRN